MSATMTPVALTSRVAVAGGVRARSALRTNKAVARSNVVVRCVAAKPDGYKGGSWRDAPTNGSAQADVGAPGVAAATAAAAAPVKAKLSMKDSFLLAMSFSGWAPETINGRVAQVTPPPFIFLFAVFIGSSGHRNE
jgi:hypothetical protein